ncbi:MAG: MBL fold metallo-hydrolase [Phycisphaerae bacterium]|nr:MBL fold metallo-hydrolase [Phycisphaerae bacterium]
MSVHVECFPLGPFSTNCYVVSETGSAACWIVDASFTPGLLADYVREAGLRPELIVLTHAHLDHIAGLDELREAFPGVPAVIHEAEKNFLEDAALNLSAGYGFPVSVRAAERTVKGGETLTLGESSWRVLHTPGHSPGGITLYCAEAGIALVGDTLFHESVGRFDFPTASERDLKRSIREVLYRLPDETRVLPGHGAETTIGHEKRENPFVRSR